MLALGQHLGNQYLSPGYLVTFPLSSSLMFLLLSSVRPQTVEADFVSFNGTISAPRSEYFPQNIRWFSDDLAESFFMSMFHNGRLRTMKANYRVAEGDLRIIRPLVYVREKHLRQFAESRKLPVIAENCPACFEVSTTILRLRIRLVRLEWQDYLV